MTANKVRGAPIKREKVFLNKNNTRPNSARKINTRRKRRAITWNKFFTLKNMEIVRSMCRKGWTNDEIADYIGISLSTFYKWQNEHVEFSEALKEPKEYCIAKVENALLTRALGIEKEVGEKETITTKDKDGKEMSKTTEKTSLIYYPPDTKAVIFYLTNRAGSDWKQKQQTEMTGKLSIDAAVNTEDRLKSALERTKTE